MFSYPLSVYIGLLALAVIAIVVRHMSQPPRPDDNPSDRRLD